MSDTPPPINAEWLARMRTTKPQLLRALFGMFLDDEPKRMEALNHAIVSGDLHMVRYLAHSLKGAAATMGMEPLRDACRELEVCAKEGDTVELLHRYSKIQIEMEAVQQMVITCIGS